MLTRQQLSAHLAPPDQSLYRAIGTAWRDFRRLLSKDTCEKAGEPRIMLAQTLTLSALWIKYHDSSRGDALTDYLNTMGYDWGDVRTLKEVEISPEWQEVCCDILDDLDCDANRDTDPELYLNISDDDLQTALHLTVWWFTEAKVAHGDVRDEFYFAQTQLLKSLNPRCNTIPPMKLCLNARLLWRNFATNLIFLAFFQLIAGAIPHSLLTNIILFIYIISTGFNLLLASWMSKEIWHCARSITYADD